jgi:MFS superfamily sulfate permease-like transporter
MSSEIENFSPFSNWKNDLPASLIVFLVAMPLCLGIAMASGAPLFAGLIAGIVGGIVVGSFSGSSLGVSGPAAGLAVIVLTAIQDLGGLQGGGFEKFLVAVVLAGVLQIVMGFLRAGVIAYYFPSSVIHGMLAGIGIIIFLKQIPHALGYDADPEGDESFFQPDAQNTFSELVNMLDYISFGPTVIALVSLAILLFWQTKWMTQFAIFRLIQGPLVAVVVGALLNVAFRGIDGFALQAEQIVAIPAFQTMDMFFSSFTSPDWSVVTSPLVIKIAVVLAIVGSLETLLCTEASDKQDPYKRKTPTNQELKAQGIGNIVSGLIGGLPITQVIVRSSVNVQAGGKTKMSAIVHGFIILVAVVFFPSVINLIPLSTLAAILFVVGYKLAKPVLFQKMYRQGMGQFVPFLVTIVGIVCTDLLIGISLGLLTAVGFLLIHHLSIPINVEQRVEKNGEIVISLSEDVSFLKKAVVIQLLENVPPKSKLIIDGSQSYHIHHDIIEIIQDYVETAEEKDIEVTLISILPEERPRLSIIA